MKDDLEPNSSATAAPAHEKLKAFQFAQELDALVQKVCQSVPRGHSWLVDQIQRAAGSTVLNIVEANGRTGSDRLQQLKIARGSALETDAALGLLANRRLIKASERLRGRQLAVAVVNLVSGMIRK